MRRLNTLLICLMVGFVGGAVAQATVLPSSTAPARRDIYELYRVSPGAPLSIVFKGTCIENEDTAAHPKLVEYNKGQTVFGCYKRRY